MQSDLTSVMIRLYPWLNQTDLCRTWRCWGECINHGWTRMDTDNARLVVNASLSHIRVYPCASEVKSYQLAWSVRA